MFCGNIVLGCKARIVKQYTYRDSNLCNVFINSRGQRFIQWIH